MEVEEKRKLFVGELAFGTTAEVLTAEFSCCGKVVDGWLIYELLMYTDMDLSLHMWPYEMDEGLGAKERGAIE